MHDFDAVTMSEASMMSDFPMAQVESLEKLTGNFNMTSNVCHDEYYKNFLSENAF